MDTNNLNSTSVVEETKNIVDNLEMSTTTQNEPGATPRKKRRNPGKVVILDEEPEISFEIDESQPDNGTEATMNSASLNTIEKKESVDDLPEEQSGKITF